MSGRKDIVERLRGATGCPYCIDAAEEIERLREALREIKKKGGTTGYGRAALVVIANAALSATGKPEAIGKPECICWMDVQSKDCPVHGNSPPVKHKENCRCPNCYDYPDETTVLSATGKDK